MNADRAFVATVPDGIQHVCVPDPRADEVRADGGAPGREARDARVDLEDRKPRDVGRQLRSVRRKQGLTRAQVARSAGLTRRELVAYERGRVEIPESDLWCLAGSCGVDVGELLAHRDELRIDPNLSLLMIGEATRAVDPPAEPDGLLREYASMIYELRRLAPGSAMPLREADLATLADALGGTPDAIEARLTDLIGATRGEAVRLREMILPTRPITAADLATHDTGTPARYAAAIQTDPAPDIDRFFAAPEEPPLEPTVVIAPAAVSPAAISEDGLSPIVPDRGVWSPTPPGETVEASPADPISWRAP